MPRTIDVELGGRHFTVALPDTLEDDDYRARDGGDEKPYWAFLWGSAVSLARVIMEGPDLTGKRVIELGAGLGLSGFAAAARGARVLSTDIRPEAVRLLAQNAAANGLDIDTAIVDFYAPPAELGVFDGILAADVIYNDGMLGGVVRFMRSHLAPGGLGCLTDPYRVMPAGVQGAARLAGLEVTMTALPASGSPVALYALTRRHMTARSDQAPVPPSAGVSAEVARSAPAPKKRAATPPKKRAATSAPKKRAATPPKKRAATAAVKKPRRAPPR